MTKKTAYLMGANMIAESNRQLGSSIRQSNRELGEKLENISKAEIKSKNRVDISLEEYENMKNKIKSLSYEVDRLTKILTRIDVPLDKDIIPDSIKTCWCEDYWNNRVKFIIEFAVDNFDLKEWENELQRNAY